MLNKIDRLPDPAARDRLLARHPHRRRHLRPLRRPACQPLAQAASDSLGRNFHDVDVETDPGNGRLLAWLGRHGEVLSRQFTDDRVTVHCRLPAALVGRIDPAEAVVTPHRAARPTGRLPGTDDLPAPPAAAG